MINSDRIEAVLFDFGGVFIDSPFGATEDYAREHGIEPERLMVSVFGSYERDTEHPWHQLERGEITRRRSEAVDQRGRGGRRSRTDRPLRGPRSARISGPPCPRTHGRCGSRRQ